MIVVILNLFIIQIMRIRIARVFVLQYKLFSRPEWLKITENVHFWSLRNFCNLVTNCKSLMAYLQSMLEKYDSYYVLLIKVYLYHVAVDIKASYLSKK